MSAGRWRWALPAVALLALAVAGCGGGGSTTVTETVTNTVEETTAAEAGTTAAEETTTPEPAPNGPVTKETSVSIPEPKVVRHLTGFQSPSGNIGCILFEGEARCDIRKRSWKPPPHPASCSGQVDFGQGLQVGDSGHASFVCAGDTTLDESAPKLAYGTGAKVDGTLCLSETKGVTCVNADGHGFSISIQGYRIY